MRSRDRLGIYPIFLFLSASIDFKHQVRAKDLPRRRTSVKQHFLHAKSVQRIYFIKGLAPPLPSSTFYTPNQQPCLPQRLRSCLMTSSEPKTWCGWLPLPSSWARLTRKSSALKKLIPLLQLPNRGAKPTRGIIKRYL